MDYWFPFPGLPESWWNEGAPCILRFSTKNHEWSLEIILNGNPYLTIVDPYIDVYHYRGKDLISLVGRAGFMATITPNLQHLRSELATVSAWSQVRKQFAQQRCSPDATSIVSSFLMY